MNILQIVKWPLRDWAIGLSSLATADILILISGLAGAVAAGFTIKLLRKNGYQMF